MSLCIAVFSKFSNLRPLQGRRNLAWQSKLFENKEVMRQNLKKLLKDNLQWIKMN